MRSPTERTLRYLRRSGYVCQVTEVWIAHQWAKPNENGSQPGTRRDLFGWCDILAVLDGQTLGIQCTAVSGMSARLRKMRGLEPEPKNLDEKKLGKFRVANYERKRAVLECLEANWTIAIYGYDKGMKLPKIRYVTKSDLVDQDELAL